MAACSESRLLDWEANGLGNTGTVLWVNLVEVRKDTLLDVTSALAESTGDIFDDLGSHVVVEDLAEELTRLLIVGVGVLVGIASSLTDEVLLFPGVSWVLDGGSHDRVGLVIRQGAVSTIDCHETISSVIVAHASTVWAVDGDLVIVGTKSVSVGVRVVDETALEHLIVGWLDTWDHVGRGEGGLLSFGMEVLWVLVENEFTNFLERIVGMRPDLGHVINIEAVVLSVSNWHHLGVPGPGWEVTLLNGVEEVHGGVILSNLAHLGS